MVSLQCDQIEPNLVNWATFETAQATNKLVYINITTNRNSPSELNMMSLQKKFYLGTFKSIQHSHNSVKITFGHLLGFFDDRLGSNLGLSSNHTDSNQTTSLNIFAKAAIFPPRSI